MYITKGSLEYWYKKLNSKGKAKMKLLKVGDLVETPPNEMHALKIGKRGNQFGKYINMGVYAGWIFHHRLKYAYTNSNIKVIESKLNYLESFNYGLSTKIGIKKNAIFINYRLSNLFEENESELLELPRIIAG